jgi:hypothetical protein
MEDSYGQEHQLRALAMRVAALEENVAFLEEWCEEQQDTLDRAAGPIGYDYEIEPEPVSRTILRVVDLRDDASPEGDGPDGDAIVAVVETEHDRRVRLIRAQLNRIRRRLAMSVAPPVPAEKTVPAERAAAPEPRRAPGGNAKVSARPAGRTAP